MALVVEADRKAERRPLTGAYWGAKWWEGGYGAYGREDAGAYPTFLLSTVWHLLALKFESIQEINTSAIEDIDFNVEGKLFQGIRARCFSNWSFFSYWSICIMWNVVTNTEEELCWFDWPHLIRFLNEIALTNSIR